MLDFLSHHAPPPPDSISQHVVQAHLGIIGIVVIVLFVCWIGGMFKGR